MHADASLAHVLLVEPNAALRSAIVSLLTAERYTVEPCDSLEDVVARTRGRAGVIALVAWQSMQGLLTDEHRHKLLALTRRVRLVLTVPRRWARLLETTDLGDAISGLVSKPIEADELLNALHNARLIPLGTHLPARIQSRTATRPAAQV